MRVVLRPSPHQLVFNDSIPGVEGMASFAETLFRAPAVRAQAEAEREGNLLRMAQRSAAKPVGPQVGEVAPSHLTDRLTSVPQDVPRLDFLGRPVLDAAGNPVVDRKMVPLPSDAASENLRRGGIDPETFRFIERAMAAEQASSAAPTGVVPQQPGQASALPAEPTLIGQATAPAMDESTLMQLAQRGRVPMRPPGSGPEMIIPQSEAVPAAPASLIQQARIHDQDPAPRRGRAPGLLDPRADDAPIMTPPNPETEAGVDQLPDGSLRFRTANPRNDVTLPANMAAILSSLDERSQRRFRAAMLSGDSELQRLYYQTLLQNTER
jgi:hypothetical protein